MRFTWRTVSDVLLDKELKNALGGYGGGYASKSYWKVSCLKNGEWKSRCMPQDDYASCLEAYDELESKCDNLLSCVGVTNCTED